MPCPIDYTCAFASFRVGFGSPGVQQRRRWAIRERRQDDEKPSDLTGWMGPWDEWVTVTQLVEDS